jgi:myo-inositol 2-dehydrogenase/D-chiro-inositol 1-dehydrogenase
MGRQHALACQRLGHRVRLVYDEDLNRAAQLALECDGADVLACPEDLMWDRIDAVFVCTPPHARGPIECAAIESGTPFFLEKPVGINAGQCAQLVGALRTRPVINSVGYMSRYRTSVRHARERLRRGAIIGMSAHWLASKYNKGWWLDRNKSGGPFNEQCTHFVDLSRYLIGDVEQVVAVADDKTMPLTVSVSLKFTTGVLGTLLYSCHSQHKQIRFQVFLENGVLALDGYDLAFEHLAAPTDATWALEVEMFCRAVAEGRPDLIESDLKDAIKTQEAVDGILSSLENEQPTALSADKNLSV